jgi:hypothetical protein
LNFGPGRDFSSAIASAGECSRSRSTCSRAADLDAVRLGGARVDADRLLDEHRGGRRLRDERERAVLVDGDDDRDRRAGIALGLRVERLAELHDVDAVLAQGGADRRRRAGLAADGLELDLREDFLCHVRGSSAAHPAPRSD